MKQIFQFTALFSHGAHFQHTKSGSFHDSTYSLLLDCACNQYSTPSRMPFAVVTFVRSSISPSSALPGQKNTGFCGRALGRALAHKKIFKGEDEAQQPCFPPATDTGRQFVMIWETQIGNIKALKKKKGGVIRRGHES